MKGPSGYELAPQTLEEMLESCEYVELFYPDGAPYSESIRPTHEWCADLCRRVLALEAAEQERRDAQKSAGPALVDAMTKISRRLAGLRF